MHALRRSGQGALGRFRSPLRTHFPSSCIATRELQISSRRSHDAFKRGLESNQRWAAETAKNDPDFFPSLAKGQSPEILWIGCSDSRKSETIILGLKPGDVFTHRNIANVVNPTDLSLISVVEFAVAHLKVKHIVVCGHTSCGGVNACLGNAKLGVLDVWLQPMKAIREKHADELAKLEGADKSTYMSKLNVQAGVEHMRRMPTVINAMRDRGLKVHGTIFDLSTGLLEDLELDEDEDAEEKRAAVFETK